MKENEQPIPLENNSNQIIYRYLFSYWIITQESINLKPVIKNTPGAMEIDFNIKIKSTIPINDLIKQLLEQNFSRNSLINPKMSIQQILSVTVHNFILLDEFESEKLESQEGVN